MSISFDKQTKSRIKKILFYYTLFFICTVIAYYGVFFITGHTLIRSTDAATQHLPLLQSFRSSVLDFFKHPLSADQWSWKFGLGADVLSIYAYYNIGDIFSYLILLFPAAKVAVGYQVILGIRLYCAGLAFCYFAAHLTWKNRPFGVASITAGSLVYLFNSYLEYASLAQPMFTTAFILFPLLVLEIERTLQTRTYRRLTFVFTWMLINNFYFAYMLGIGAIVFLVLRYWLYYRKQRPILATIWQFAKATLISLLLSAVVLLPEIYDVLHSTRSESSFANGLKVYPLYYYLLLPSKLIEGTTNNQLYWTSLGFAAIAFFGFAYVLLNYKQLKLLTISIIGSLIALLFPAVAAVLNGMMSPSNRWTFVLYLIGAVATMLLVHNVRALDSQTLRRLTLITSGYTVILVVLFFIQNADELFVPIIFLWGTLFILYWVNFHQVVHGRRLLVGTVLANVILNCVYFAAPFNNNFATSFLPIGGYEALTTDFYKGLTTDLDQKSFYRSSTISDNYLLGGPSSSTPQNLAIANPIYTGINSINSFYSLQNKYIGQLMQELQNRQTLGNIPVGQADDRTILTNLLGTKYIFGKTNNPNSSKIPYGFSATAQTPLYTDLYGNQLPGQVVRYDSANNFPLVYWQGKVVTPKTYHQLNATAKEAQLTTGVVMPSTKSAQGLPRAKKAPVADVPYSLYTTIPTDPQSDDPGNITGQAIVKQNTNEQYYITIPDYKKYKNMEVHLELTDIKFEPLTRSETIQANNDYHAQENLTNTIPFNTLNDEIKGTRNYITKMKSDHNFTLTATAKKNTVAVRQLPTSDTSFYYPLTKTTLNLGYFTTMPNKIMLNLSRIGRYNFKLKVYAEPLGKTYQKHVQTIQKNQLSHLKVGRDTVTGISNHSQAGVLTSSIPYSDGWTTYIDGHKVSTLRTNRAFVGVKVPQGKHKVRFVYHTPWLKLGTWISLGTTLVLLSWGLIRWGFWIFRRRNA